MRLSAGPVLAAGGGSGLLGVRLLLLFGVLLLLVAVVGFLRQAWRRRATRDEQDLPELLDPPEETGGVLAAPLRGAYLGTADAGHWLEWFSASGLGGKEGSYISVYESGVRVDRRGKPFWIPREAVRGARFERAHVGKVAAPGRLLVIAWSLDGRELETGFRGDDRARQPQVMRSVHELIGPPTAPTDGEITSPRPAVRSLRQLRPRRHNTLGVGLPGGRGRGTQQAQPGRAAQAQPGRGLRPRRRERPRSLEQEIADRRGADPYGTGPRLAGAAGIDPYVTGPRAQAVPPTGPRAQPAPPTGPRAQAVPRTGPHSRTAGLYREPEQPTELLRPVDPLQPGPGEQYGQVGQYPQPPGGFPATGPAAPGQPGPAPRGAPTARPPAGGAAPGAFVAAQPTAPRVYPAPVAPPAPPDAYGPAAQAGRGPRPGGPYPDDRYPGGGQYPRDPGAAPGSARDPYPAPGRPATGPRGPYPGRPGAAAPVDPRAQAPGPGQGPGHVRAPGQEYPAGREPYPPRDPDADPRGAAGAGGAADDPYADPYGRYDARRQRPRPRQ